MRGDIPPFYIGLHVWVYNYAELFSLLFSTLN